MKLLKIEHNALQFALVILLPLFKATLLVLEHSSAHLILQFPSNLINLSHRRGGGA